MIRSNTQVQRGLSKVHHARDGIANVIDRRLEALARRTRDSRPGSTRPGWMQPRIRRLALATVLVAAVGLNVLVPANGARAAVDPASGPTTGGTTVHGTVPGLTFTGLSSGVQHSLALGTDGYVYAWGVNTLGQLGDGTAVRRGVPARVATPEGVTFSSIGTGDHSSFAIAVDGRVYAWGENASGNLGDGSAMRRLTPVPVEVPAGVTFIDVEAGAQHSVALASDGRAFTWGSNAYGQLGTGATESIALPVSAMMPADVRYTMVDAGTYHSLAIGTDGQIYAWGLNYDGQLGDGTLVSRSTPVRVNTPPGVIFATVAASHGFSAAISTDGDVYAWGRNTFGQLGDGTIQARAVPTRVNGPIGERFTEIALAGDATYAKGADGDLYAWGGNWAGQLGDGTAVNRSLPGRVHAASEWGLSGIAAGGSFAMAISSSGAAYAWGLNWSGALGVGGSPSAVRTPLEVTPEDPLVLAVRFGGAPAAMVAQRGRQWEAAAPPGCGLTDVEVDFELYGAHHTMLYQRAYTFGAAPSMTVHPQGAEVLVDSAVELWARAEGDPRPSVLWQQWEESGGRWLDIPDATSPTYQPVTGSRGAKSYRAVFTNCFAGAASEAATIEVVDPAVDVAADAATTAPPRESTQRLAAAGGRFVWAGPAAGAGLLAAGLLLWGWLRISDRSARFAARVARQGRH